MKKVIGQQLVRMDRAIEMVERLVLANAILLMAGVGVANVLARNLAGYSFSFAEELNQILTILVTFLGIGFGARHARHIRMSALYDQLKGGWRKGLMVVTSLGTGLLLFTLAWYALHYVGDVHRVGSVTPALRLPLYLVYVWVPVGLLLGGVQYLLGAWRNLTAPGIHSSFQQPETYAPEGDGGGN